MQSKDDKQTFYLFSTMQILAIRGKERHNLFSKSKEYTVNALFPKSSQTNYQYANAHMHVFVFTFLILIPKKKVDVQIWICFQVTNTNKLLFEIKRVEKITTLYDFEINTCFDTRKWQIQTKDKSKSIIDCQQQITFS